MRMSKIAEWFGWRRREQPRRDGTTKADEPRADSEGTGVARSLEASGYRSPGRHTALLRVACATSDEERAAAHVDLRECLINQNVWIALLSGPQRTTVLNRAWPEPPFRAVVSFPDTSTAERVCTELKVPEGHWQVALLSYDDAVKTASENRSCLVMVAYHGDTPHYIPILYEPSA
jgi:hypothetical protein